MPMIISHVRVRNRVSGVRLNPTPAQPAKKKKNWIAMKSFLEPVTAKESSVLLKKLKAI